MSRAVAPPSESEPTRIAFDEFKVGLQFPADAWLASEHLPLTVSLVEIDESSDAAKAVGAIGGRLMGEAVLFEPSGTQFGKPVAISLPFDTAQDIGNLELAVHVFDRNSSAWLRKAYAGSMRTSVDMEKGVVRALTSSFSLYAVLAVDPLPITTTPPNIDNSSVAPSLKKMFRMERCPKVPKTFSEGRWR
mmetsp:Transcript_1615/g.3324  ORF Transcript_1615/g.3324 Transcript_1615/m.3324 type:complete len:190 (-) Transcript_1615:19-588(-)